MFCFWCQSGKVPRNLEEKGFVWIHLDCLMELISFGDDLEGIREILGGKRAESIELYLERMQEFDKRSENLMKLIRPIKID